MRVAQDEFTTAKGTRIDLRVDIHNGGKVDRQVALEHEAWELEINGRWLKVTGGMSGDQQESTSWSPNSPCCEKINWLCPLCQYD